MKLFTVYLFYSRVTNYPQESKSRHMYDGTSARLTEVFINLFYPLLPMTRSILTSCSSVGTFSNN